MKHKLLGAISALALLASTQANAVNLAVDGNIQLLAGTATATSGAATLANKAGTITSESLSTAAAAIYTLTITNTAVAATDLCFASTAYGTSTTGNPAIARVAPGAGSLVVIVQNIAAAAALNGTITVTFMCFKP